MALPFSPNSIVARRGSKCKLPTLALNSSLHARIMRNHAHPHAHAIISITRDTVFLPLIVGGGRKPCSVVPDDDDKKKSVDVVVFLEYDRKSLVSFNPCRTWIY